MSKRWCCCPCECCDSGKHAQYTVTFPTLTNGPFTCLTCAALVSGATFTLSRTGTLPTFITNQPTCNGNLNQTNDVWVASLGNVGGCDLEVALFLNCFHPDATYQVAVWTGSGGAYSNIWNTGTLSSPLDCDFINLSVAWVSDSLSYCVNPGGNPVIVNAI